jgi:hypothetical protein
MTKEEVEKNEKECWISCSHGGHYEEYFFLGCYAIYSGGIPTTFRKNILPPSSRLKSEGSTWRARIRRLHHLRQEQYISPERPRLSTRLHCVTFQSTVFFIGRVAFLLQSITDVHVSILCSLLLNSSVASKTDGYCTNDKYSFFLTSKANIIPEIFHSIKLESFPV